MLNRFYPADVIAVISLIGGLILKLTGADGTINAMIATIIAAYFGKRIVYDEIAKSLPSKGKFKTIKERIRDVAKDMSVDPDVAVRVAKCESGLDPQAVHKNADGSLDRGLFQWNDKWHPEITDEIAFDVEKSTTAFCEAVKNNNLSWWSASEKCWRV